MTVLLIGSATGERVGACRASLEQRGHDVAVFGYDRVLAGDVPQLFGPEVRVRLESPSDDPVVDAALVRAGHGVTTQFDGEYGLLESARWVSGLGQALRQLDEWVHTSRVTPLYDTGSVLTMFDKRETRRRVAAVGAPVAPLAEIGDPAIFVKSRYGSSGAGILALHAHSGRVSGWTTVGFESSAPGLGERPINVHPRRVTSAAEVARVLTAIEASGGTQIERWVPKFSAAGRAVDLRVVVIRGHARQVLARAARQPITNLHLGAERADVDALAAALGPDRWAAALAAAELAMTAFPDAHHAGVDVGLDQRGRPFILEVNAFGDFHTGIVDAQGLDTYTAELA